MPVFVVTMFRGSAVVTHMYTLGVYTSYREALTAKVTEELRTDDRFIGYIDEFQLDAHPTDDSAQVAYESSLSRHAVPIDVNKH